MVATIKEYVEELWWLFILQGLASILFGIVALFYPGITLVALVVTMAVYAAIVGVIDTIHSFSSIGKSKSWWFSLILGLSLMGLGIYLIRNPSLSIGVFIILVGTVFIVRGIFDLTAASFFSGGGGHRWLMAISGVLGIIAGLYIWTYPTSGGLAFIWAIGLYALFTGSMTIAYAFQMKGVLDEIKRTLERTSGSRIAHGHR